MATSVAAALAAELGLRTAAELRPAGEAPAAPRSGPGLTVEPGPRPEASLAGESPAAAGSTAVITEPGPAPQRAAVITEPRPAAPLDGATRPGGAAGTVRPPRAILPVTSDISGLLPYGGLATVTAIMASRRGATSLLWRLLAGPTRAGAWCALVGMPGRYPLAATAAGADLERVAFVDAAGPLIADAAGALAEGVAAMVVPSDGLTPAQARRLTARARKGGTAIVWWETRPVAGPDARLEVARVRWKGLRANAGRLWGAGRLDACELDVNARWRSGGGHRARIWPYGGPEGAKTATIVDFRARELWR